MISILNLFIKKNDFVLGIYDLSKNPISFNFFEFLIFLEMQRQFKKKKYIHIKIVDPLGYLDENKMNGQGFMISNEHRFIDMFFSIIKLFKNISHFSISKKIDSLKGKDKNNHYSYSIERHQNYIFLNYNNIKEKIFKDASDNKIYNDWCLLNSIDPKKVITITLRDFGFEDYRNSDIDIFCRIYDYFESNGFFPIIIYDIEREQFNPALKKRRLCDIASTSSLVKLIFYQNSLLNVSSSNLPQIFSIFSNTNYMTFRNPRKDGLTDEIFLQCLQFKSFFQKDIFRKVFTKGYSKEDVELELKNFLNFYKNEQNSN